MTELAREYGEGLFELAKEEHLMDEILEQMNGMRDAFNAEPRFIQLLQSHAIPKEERLKILDDSFRSQVHVYLLSFMKLLLERGAIDHFAECAKYFYARYCEDQNIAVAQVTAAQALTEEQKSALRSKLSGISGKKIELNIQVDPDVLGGIRVDMEGYRYDNTIQHRLNLMRRRLADEA